MIHKKGFTLIELMVVVSVIGLLVGGVFTYLDSAREKSRDGRRIEDINQLNQAVINYFDTCFDYPADINLLSASSVCPNGVTQVSPLLNTVTVDPLNDSTYNYQYYKNSSPKKYHLCAKLENVVASGVLKAAKSPLNPSDQCDGASVYVYDKYGPY